MSGYYKSRHRHRLAVSPKRGVSSYEWACCLQQYDKSVFVCLIFFFRNNGIDFVMYLTRVYYICMIIVHYYII